ncbi:protein-tyrosine kinase [Listeria floridensis FSL S10-1187]|uniref:non-specific protein-tyrosine kinase n=1 Tax=Listeria floridensis FSL S10-1187 TaxID=1265817 RepID=A0ABN0RD18_9LIST|nr:CpsD/CapB family tyrosine-protein kinase [Listeria floridensis]EUJ28486.1 protein-tyrosine kinase [Listeria floridensis FSL S10-1187]
MKLQRSKKSSIIQSNEVANEKFSSIQTNIQFMRANGQNVQTITVTSASKGEGKTFFSSNFASTYAQFKQKTLLVDTDFYSPKLSRENYATTSKGLSNYLIGDATFEEAAQPLDDYLDLIPTGVIPPNPLELIKTHDLSGLIQDALTRYEMIIFDCPPITIFTDARIYAALSDLGILVVNSGKTMEDDFIQARNFLADSGVRAIGAVLNNSKYDKRRYDYYGS